MLRARTAAARPPRPEARALRVHFVAFASRGSAAAARLGLLPVAAAGLLAGCGHKAPPPADTETVSVAFANPGNAEAGGDDGNAAQTVSIEVPGFAARLNLPGVVLGAGGAGLDGIAFQPGTRLTGMRILGKAGDGSGGDGHGAVDIGFAAPAAPARVIAYYRDAARRGGWSEVPPAAGQQFAATKAKTSGAEHLALQVSPQGSGSRGRFLLAGS